MKPLFAALIVAQLLGGCAATYKRPETLPAEHAASIPASRADIVRAAKQVLVAEGFQISSYDDAAGVVTTALRDFRLDPSEADCGTTLGIDYLKDNRTVARLGFGIVARDGRAVATATMEAYYRVGSATQDITLSCISRGVLEPPLLAKIAAAARP
jgi:hypothetical protein